MSDIVRTAHALIAAVDNVLDLVEAGYLVTPDDSHRTARTTAACDELERAARALRNHLASRRMPADVLQAQDAYEQTESLARHTDIASVFGTHRSKP